MYKLFNNQNGGKKSSWHEFLHSKKGLHMTMKELSAEYRKNNNVKTVKVTECKNKVHDECNRPCKWIIPKKLTKTGKLPKEHCRKVPPKGKIEVNYSYSPISKKINHSYSPIPNKEINYSYSPISKKINHSYSPIPKKEVNNNCNKFNGRRQSCLDNDCTWHQGDNICTNEIF